MKEPTCAHYKITRKVKPTKKFSRADQHRAYRQGWGLFEVSFIKAAASSGRRLAKPIQIQKLDQLTWNLKTGEFQPVKTPFNTDVEAILFVLENSRRSKICRRAIRAAYGI